MHNLFTHPPRLPLIAASILSADFTRMGDECRDILASGADLLHLDVMDGHFVPNLTMGPDMCRWIRRALPDAFLDVHLMVQDPAMYAEPFAAAGANHLSFHIEVLSDEQSVELADQVRALGLTAGIAVNPATPADRIAHLLSRFDLALIMSVNPGFSGQKFMAEVLEKAQTLQPHLRPGQRIEIDGGIGPETAAPAREAGCDVLVAASAIFGQPPDQRASVVTRLRGTA